jgi:hypothetical protein
MRLAYVALLGRLEQTVVAAELAIVFRQQLEILRDALVPRDADQRRQNRLQHISAGWHAPVAGSSRWAVGSLSGESGLPEPAAKHLEVTPHGRENPGTIDRELTSTGVGSSERILEMHLHRT